MVKQEKVTRVEVIDEKGRAYVRHDIAVVELHYQDDGKTLKIFVSGNIKLEKPSKWKQLTIEE